MPHMKCAVSLVTADDHVHLPQGVVCVRMGSYTPLIIPRSQSEVIRMYLNGRNHM